MFGLVGLRCHNRQVHIVDFLEAVGFHADDVFLVRGNHRHNVQVDRAGQHNAVVVVGVVAADLGTAGGRVQPHGAFCAKAVCKAVDHGNITFTLLGGNLLPCTIQFCKSGVILALQDLLFELQTICHRFHSPFLCTALGSMHNLHIQNLGTRPVRY